jgi:hypothetical protein
MVSPAPGPEQLEVASIGIAELETWAQVKLQSFADSEDAPAADAVTAEVEVRRRELPLAEYQLGVVDGQPAAVLAHYPGTNDLVFILGTRTPYRHRGIARAMLARWASQRLKGVWLGNLPVVSGSGEPTVAARRPGSGGRGEYAPGPDAAGASPQVSDVQAAVLKTAAASGHPPRTRSAAGTRSVRPTPRVHGGAAAVNADDSHHAACAIVIPYWYGYDAPVAARDRGPAQARRRG